MRIARRRLLAATLLLLAIVAGCAPVPPDGGLSQPAAFAAARMTRPDITGVASGRVGQMGDFDADQRLVPDDLWVWAVVVSGSFPFSCGPAPVGPTQHPCPPPGTTMTVLLDYRTGAFVESLGTAGS